MAGLNPIDHNEIKHRVQLESQLEDALKSIGLLTNSGLSDTIENNRIVEECQAVRKALQDLFDSYSDNVSNLNAFIL